MIRKKAPKTPKEPKKTVLKNTGKGILLAIAIGVLIFGIEYGLAWLLYWLIGAEKLTQPFWNAVYQALVYAITLAFIISAPILLSKLKTAKNGLKWAKTLKIDREEAGLRGLPTWTDIGLAPVGLLVYFLAAAGLVALFKLFPWFNALENQDVGFNNIYAGADRVIAFIALVVIAPVAEEIIFRGWLYGKLRNRLKIIPAMLIVSILFGVLHGQWNVGVNVFALSLVLCGLREITGTIYAGMIVHILKNALAFYLLYLVL
ncbi:CPBP family intramembrane metalloprotease [Candidatus Saccharibacteria bacterium]|nr:CPBP family intramembrane metalloprotease [Candidatus Saccharibacteria bacterium]